MTVASPTSPASSVHGPAEPPRLRRVVLAGFMGCGKTTVGRLLAHRLGWGFRDLDDAVAEREGRSVPQILRDSGEPFFREAETRALAALLTENNLVIALGGGAPETAALRHLLRSAEETAVLHLQASFHLLYERCRQQAQDPLATARPLLGSVDETEARYLRRQPFYEEIAHGTADAGLPTPELVAESLLALLNR